MTTRGWTLFLYDPVKTTGKVTYSNKDKKLRESIEKYRKKEIVSFGKSLYKISDEIIV